MSLQKLWDYCLSVISGTVLSWNVVITRIGIPTVSETAGTLLMIKKNTRVTLYMYVRTSKVNLLGICQAIINFDIKY